MRFSRKYILVFFGLIILFTIFTVTQKINKKYGVDFSYAGQDFATTVLYKADRSTPEQSNVDSSKEVATISRPQIIKLQEGPYVAVIKSDKYLPTKIPFFVNKEGIKIVISPELSEKGLDELAKKESPAIKVAVAKDVTKFDSSVDTISDIAVYIDGSWASAVLIKDGVPADNYHVVLQKTDNSWKVVTTPSIVLTAAKYKTIPKDVLDSANKITSSNSVVDNPATNRSSVKDRFTGDGTPPEQLRN